MSTPPSVEAIKAFRTPEIIAWQDRHRYTAATQLRDPYELHEWDAAEAEQHQASQHCPCKPLSGDLDGYQFYFHEFDATATAPVPPRT